MRILQEIKQRRPFSSRAEETTVTLLRTADVVRRRVGEAVEVRGITGQQYNVLRILRGAGQAGLPTLEIAQRMVEQTPGITRLIDRLERKRLVRRERGADDRRRVYCRITRAGSVLLAGLDKPVRCAIEAAFHRVTKQELAELIELLDRLRESASATKSEE